LPESPQKVLPIEDKMHGTYREIDFQWELPHLSKAKTEHGRAPRWGAKMNRNDAFLARRGKGKPIKKGR